MTSARLLSVLLVLVVSLSITACDTGSSGDDEGDELEPCPATGAPLLPELPKVLPAYTDGCEDSTWASDVEATVAWTIELERGSSTSSMVVVPSVDGAVAISGRRALWVSSTGEVTSERDLGSAPSWNRVQGSLDGRLVVTGSSGSAPYYRVLDERGAELWLRLLDPNSGVPSVALDGGDVLLGAFDFSGDEVMLRIERWGVTGSKKSELVLAAYNDAFARDGAGHYGVLLDGLHVFDSDGTPLGIFAPDNSAGESYVAQFVGTESGFYVAGGGEDPFVGKVSVTNGEVVVDWTYTLGDPAGIWEFANALALLPDGGVVIVGEEAKIRVAYPMSLLTTNLQPFVLAFDADGQPTWGERIGVPGQALGVAVGAAGEVYVGGTAQAGPPGQYGGSISATWLRRYNL
jgi:hypothetical protein